MFENGHAQYKTSWKIRNADRQNLENYFLSARQREKNTNKPKMIADRDRKTIHVDKTVGFPRKRINYLTRFYILKIHKTISQSIDSSILVIYLL
jgi:hypothetical protein